MAGVPRRRTAGGRRGFTLLEVTVALGVLATAIVTIAQLFTVASRAAGQARVGTAAAVLAADKMEQLRALAWGYSAEGVECTDTTTDVAVHPETLGGRGLSPSMSGTLANSVPGYVDYYDDRGRWVGTGEAPPPGTAFIRRWSIAPLADSPADTLVLRVVVVRVGGRVLAGELPAAGPDIVQLVALRFRRGE